MDKSLTRGSPDSMTSLDSLAAIDNRNATVSIAIVAPSLDDLGGQSIQADKLTDCLRSEGYRVIFIPTNPRFPYGLAWIKRIPFLRTLINEVIFIVSLRLLRKIDVAHIFSASYWSFLLAPAPAILASRFFSKRTILNYHSGEAEDHLQNWGWRVHPWLAKVDEIVVPSEFLRSVFQKYGYNSTVVLNLVDSTNYQFRLRQPFRPRLFSNRNLEFIYGVENTILAFAALKKVYPDATLVIAGSGSKEGSLKEIVRAEGLADIEFVGRISPPDMPGFFDRADFFLNSSTVDNQPVSILEAFASGCLVVSTPTGDIPAMVEDAHSGRLVPHGNPQAMASAVQSLIEDDKQATAIAQAALAKLSLYSWTLQREKWNQVYHGVVS